MDERSRYFEYTGSPVLTRGGYGVNVRGGHNTTEGPEADPEAISVFDPDHGEVLMVSIEAGLASGDWAEISEGKWASLM